MEENVLPQPEDGADNDQIDSIKDGYKDASESIEPVSVGVVEVDNKCEEKEGDAVQHYAIGSPVHAIDGTKFSDDGYNSESCCSGETSKEETVEPLLNKKDSINDEAGYAIPEFVPQNRGKNQNKARSEKRKSLRSLLCGSTVQSAKEDMRDDDMNKNYYNPPADVRDSYFLPKSEFPIVRVLLSLTVALAVSFTCLFLMLVTIPPLMAFIVASVIFIIIFVIPLTLLHQSLLCVVALIFPSLFSGRMKIAGYLILVIFIVIGPIIGLSNKISIASNCNGNMIKRLSLDNIAQANYLEENTNIEIESRTAITTSDTQRECIRRFRNVSEHCYKEYSKFQESCNRSFETLSDNDQGLCRKSRDSFCLKDSSLATCSIFNITKKDVLKDVQRVFIYLLPLLFLVLCYDAYMYNKVYLTTKFYDNIYITQQLQTLDSERKSRGLTDLILPLTRIEFQTYFMRSRCSLSRSERWNVYKWLRLLLAFLVISFSFIYIENQIDYVFLKALNSSPSCRQIYEAEAGTRCRRYIYGLLTILFLVTLFQSYMLRLRSLICAKFYPDMVGMRARHLYYKILHDRNSFARHVRRKVQLLAESKRLNRRISCMNMLYHIFPDCLQGVCRKIAVKKCMICDSLAFGNTVECLEEKCRAQFCYECFVDSGQQCMLCQVPLAPPPRKPSGLSRLTSIE